MPEHLPDAWDAASRPTTTSSRTYVLGYADLMEAMATALGWPAVRTDRFVAVDATTPFPFQNCVVPLRPFGTDEVDDVIGEVESFFRGRDGRAVPALVRVPRPRPLRPRAGRSWATRR